MEKGDDAVFTKIFGRKKKQEPSKQTNKEQVAQYLQEAEEYVKLKHGTQFHAHLIASLRWVIEAPVFEEYCCQYKAKEQSIVRMAYASYIACLMIKGMEQHLSEKQVNEGLDGIIGYLGTQSWCDTNALDNIWRTTFRNMPYELTPGKRSGVVSLLAFLLINIDEAGFHNIINTAVSPQLCMALDACILQNRSILIQTTSVVAASALGAGCVSQV